MAVTNSQTLISIMADLTERTRNWNNQASDLLHESEDLFTESQEVQHQAETTHQHAMETVREDEKAVREAEEWVEELKGRSEELFEMTSQWVEIAQKKESDATECFGYWLGKGRQTEEWIAKARKDYERAVKEYNEAVEVYNQALEAYNRAVDRYNSCVRSQRQDRDGKLHPSCDSQYNRLRDAERSLERAKARLDAAKVRLDAAEEQVELANRCMEYVNRTLELAQEAKRLAQETLSLAKTACRYAEDALDEVRSAEKMTVRAAGENREQQALAELSERALREGDESLGESMLAVRNMNSLEEFCNKMNALLATELEDKSLLMNKFQVLTLEMAQFKLD